MKKTNVRYVNRCNLTLVNQLNDLLKNSGYRFEYEYVYNRHEQIIKREYIIKVLEENSDTNITEPLFWYSENGQRCVKKITYDDVIAKINNYMTAYKETGYALHQPAFEYFVQCFDDIKNILEVNKTYNSINSKLKTTTKCIKTLKV